MNKKRPSALGPLPVDVPTADEFFFDNLTNAIISKGKAWSKVPAKDQRIEKISTLIQDLKKAIREYQDPSWSALIAFKLATEIYDFDEEELTKTLKTELAKAAANSRHIEKQDQYAHALVLVEVNLDGNTYPNWEHADFTNWIMSEERYSKLSRRTLLAKIRKVFKDRGLDDRIAKGPAKHFKPSN